MPFEVSHIDDSFNADGRIEFEVKVKNPPAVDFERNRQYNLTLAVTVSLLGGGWGREGGDSSKMTGVLENVP